MARKYTEQEAAAFADARLKGQKVSRAGKAAGLPAVRARELNKQLRDGLELTEPDRMARVREELLSGFERLVPKAIKVIEDSFEDPESVDPRVAANATMVLKAAGITVHKPEQPQFFADKAVVIQMVSKDEYDGEVG